MTAAAVPLVTVAADAPRGLPREGSPLIARVLALPPAERIDYVAGLTNDDALALLYDWRVWGRPKQFAPPGKWTAWLNMGGRGSGKTRVGAEWIQEKAQTSSTGRLALVGITYSDVLDTMIEGESGIMSVARPDFRPVLKKQSQRLVWPNGAQAKLFSAEKPRRLRGPQHEYVWSDEIAAYQYPSEVFNQIMFGLRIGAQPQLCMTTTPKPIELLIELVKDAVICHDLRDAPADAEILQRSIRCVVTTQTSFENRANLADEWFNNTIAPYLGTRLGDQEVLGKLMTDIEGALWSRELIDKSRIKLDERLGIKLPEMVRIVVACDPAVTTAKASNETGIIVCGKGDNGHAYVMADKSGRHKPDAWAQELVRCYEKYDADRIIGEVNNGGDLIEATVRTVDPNVAYKAVRASKGKLVRAEPIAALYEQGKIHHVGTFGLLEAQMTTWVPDSGLASPDRMDALVWGLTDLMLRAQGAFVA